MVGRLHLYILGRWVQEGLDFRLDCMFMCWCFFGCLEDCQFFDFGLATLFRISGSQDFWILGLLDFRFSVFLFSVFWDVGIFGVLFFGFLAFLVLGF